MKISFIINTDMVCLLERIDTCHNNLKPSTTKITNHLASGYSLFTHCSVDTTKNKLNSYRDKDCMKNVCTDLKDHAKEKKMIQLTYKENEFYKKQKVCYICKKRI